MNIYVYDHCPYCTRVRMLLGAKSIPHQLQFLPSDDEATPIGLIGKKVLPILQPADATAIGESLDIVHLLDQAYGARWLSAPADEALSAWIAAVSSPLYRLAIPRFIDAGLAEFATPSAREYFIRSKSQAFGPFDELLEQTPQLVASVESQLQQLPLPAAAAELRMDDILLYPLLRSMSVIGELRLPAAVQAYAERMMALTGLNGHAAVSHAG